MNFPIALHSNDLLGTLKLSMSGISMNERENAQEIIQIRKMFTVWTMIVVNRTKLTSIWVFRYVSSSAQNSKSPCGLFKKIIVVLYTCFIVPSSWVTFDNESSTNVQSSHKNNENVEHMCKLLGGWPHKLSNLSITFEKLKISREKSESLAIMGHYPIGIYSLDLLHENKIEFKISRFRKST